MSKVFGIIILFAAAWLMVRLQAGGGSCCGGGYKNPDHIQGSCGDGTTAEKVEKKDLIED